MTKNEKIKNLVEEMRAMNENAKKENRSFTNDEKTLFNAKEIEINNFKNEIEAEERASKIANFSTAESTVSNTRANDFAKTGKMEIRSVLSTGKIAKPSQAGDISDLADVAVGIVDDVHAIPLSGSGAWIAPYKKTNATAGKTTDGSKVGGTGSSASTGSTYDYVSISPDEWGVLDEISNQVKKMSPAAYQSAVEGSALIALREYASSVIVEAIKKSTLAETRNSVSLNETYVRNLLLNFRSIAGKGEVKLYLTQSDLATLGAVRGTNEKLPVYEIEYEGGTTLAGTIKDGGSAVKFRITDKLADGVQLFGQPGTVDMPMWDNYAIETDSSGDYFARNVMGIRGIQTANADLVAYHGMQIIKQAAATE